MNIHPLQLCWCGEDAIVATFPLDSGLLVLGPEGDWIKYSYDAPVAIIPEIDCVRVLSSSSQEMLQKVPDFVVSAFSIGSTDPVALLINASELLNPESYSSEGVQTIKGSEIAKGYQAIRDLRLENVLSKAVFDAIHAALSQFDSEEQQILLKAAVDGKLFLDAESNAATKAFMKAYLKLRILNVVRHEGIGFTLTIGQLMKIGGVTGLCRRLVRFNHHFLAMKVLETYWNFLPKKEIELIRKKIIHHWVLKYMKNSIKEGKTDVEIIERILEKTKKHPKLDQMSVGFSSFSLLAFSLNRRELALHLLKSERSFKKKIICLFHFKEYEFCFQLAKFSPDWMAFIISQTKETKFNFNSQLYIQEQSNNNQPSKFIEKFQVLQQKFENYKKDHNKNHHSLLALISSFLFEGREAEALSLKKEYLVSDISFLVCKIQVYVRKREWKKLANIVNESRNLKVDIVIFYCVRYGCFEEAISYCDRLKNDEDKAVCLFDCEKYEEAVRLSLSPKFRGNNFAVQYELKNKIQVSLKISKTEKERLLQILAK